ncbi:hypothetical protein Z043_106550 [Scleropages formosus]|nr:hypothetical protein Z043_106550 [Scleropages formosus]
MSDHYVKVRVQLEHMKVPGRALEGEAVEAGVGEGPVQKPAAEPVPPGAPPGPDGASGRRRDAGGPPAPGRSAAKGRSARSAVGKDSGDVAANGGEQGLDGGQGAAENTSGDASDRNSSEPTLQVQGKPKVLQGKTESNGVTVPSIQLKDAKSQYIKDEGSKLVKKKRPVTVDTSKAKTSLEALKVSIRQLKWKEFPLGRRVACDIYWHGVSFHDNENIVSGQVNKFPGMIEMLRKINLSRAVRTMQELFPEEYNFYPRSWIMPEEFQLFNTQIRMAKDSDVTWNPTFIVKPDGGSQGDGIYLIRDPRDLRLAAGAHSKHAIVQEYIQKPLLIDKLKFDIRLYVLVKSLEPLEIYIAKEGLSRFCTEPYQEPSPKNLNRVFMHLTNYSLNVHSGNFIHSDSYNTGSKRTFSSVLYRLASKGVDIKRVWSDIISLVIKTVIALVPELKVYYQADIPPGKPGPTCFQILGFDILLMKNLKPVLLEVNANPSMRIEHEQEVSPGVFEYVPSPVDEEVKVGVIRDTLRLVDPAQRKTL